MEPVKFEENIREQLAKREIKASADSWDKLQEKLEQRGTKSRPIFWWIGIAAAAVVVLFIVGVFFNSPAIDKGPAVVDQNSEEIIQKNEVINTSEKVEKEEDLKSDATPERKPRVLKKGLFKPDLIEKMKARTRVAEVESSLKSVQEQDIAISEPTIAMREFNASRSSTDVTDTEIEALLKEAQVSIELDSSLRESYAVNPAELLDDVEYELEEGFRQKVFEALKEGFSKAKTAVANRNF